MFKPNTTTIFLTFSLFLLFSSVSSGQLILKDPLQNYFSSYQPEKAYVQTNQYQYLSGESIFYKVYLMSKDGPSQYTKNVYAEWYNQDGIYISRQVLPSIIGLAAGDFQIPKNYTGQWIYMKLYTAWMQEQNLSPFLVSALRVLQPQQPILSPDKGLGGLQIIAQPEGGSLIKGISSILTISTKNGNNLPLGMNCRIVDASGQVVSLVSTAPYGWGQVEFKPESTETYYVQAEVSPGSWVQQALPQILGKGVGVRFDPVDHSFVVQRTSDLAKQKILIAVMHKNDLLLETTVSFEERLGLRGKIRTDSFPEGFHRLIWFDGDKNFLGQRVFFLHRPEPVSITIQTDTLNTNKNGENSFTLFTQDSLLTSLSLSVTDADFDESHPNNNINQLIGTDIFKSVPSQTQLAIQWVEQQNYRALDQWLQAQDIWYPDLKEAISGQLIPMKAKKEQSFINISGKITNLGDRRTKKAGTMNLILNTRDDENHIMTLDLASDGSFQQKDLFYYDSVTVYLQPNKIVITSENKVTMQTNLLAANPKRIIRVPTLQIDPSRDSLLILQQKYAAEKRFLDSLTATRTLSDVLVSARIKSRVEELDEKYTTGMFATEGIRFDVSADNNAIAMSSVFAYLQGRVAGLQIQLNDFSGPSITWRGDRTAVFLNEVQLQDANTLNNISMADVAYVKVFRPPFYGAYLGGSGGAIVVYTKKGDEQTNYDFASLRRVKLEGYAKPSNWENSLSYQYEPKKNNKDIRKTLYWNPSIQIGGEQRSFTFRFKNNDVTTRYRIIAEGFNEQGKLVRIEKIITH